MVTYGWDGKYGGDKSVEYEIWYAGHVRRDNKRFYLVELPKSSKLPLLE